VRRLLFAVATVMTLAGLVLREDAHGLSVVVRAANLHGPLRRAADLDVVPVAEHLVVIPSAGGAIRARLYKPPAPVRHAVLLVSGLNPAGLDEPRLRSLARTLAEADVVVAVPEVPELSRFEITATITDRIEQAALWLARDSGLAPDGRIGLMGISFSGGLALVAAARPSLNGRLRYVFSFGGHDDLGRVLAFFCSGSTAGDCNESSLRSGPPHDYGLAVVLLTVADRLVPPDQVEPLRAAVRRDLWASYLERDAGDAAQCERTAILETANRMPEPSATLLRSVVTRDVARLGPLLRPHVGAWVTDPALSPSLAPAPAVPVFLLHGRDDTVIPASESAHLAARLHGHVPVRLLLTDVISHAEADRPARVSDVLRLAHFWGALLAR
jgi:dienelactone hydrolase